MSLDFIRRGDVTKGSNLVAPGEAAKVWNREGFRMAAGRERSIRYRAGGPASESLRRTNPREGGDRLAVYGDLSE